MWLSCSPAHRSQHFLSPLTLTPSPFSAPLPLPSQQAFSDDPPSARRLSRAASQPPAPPTPSSLRGQGCAEGAYCQQALQPHPGAPIAVLYCTVLYCTVLYCTVLHCTVLYCTVLFRAVLNCTELNCAVPGAHPGCCPQQYNLLCVFCSCGADPAGLA